ncbi:hypothetical protein OAK19_00340 [Aureispira]|nr:hypothetical protein [Aureispira sp.]
MDSRCAGLRRRRGRESGFGPAGRLQPEPRGGQPMLCTRYIRNIMPPTRMEIYTKTSPNPCKF